MSTPALIGIAIVSLIVAGCAVFLWARYIFSAPFAEEDHPLGDLPHLPRAARAKTKPSHKEGG